MLVDRDGNTMLHFSLLRDQSLEEHQVSIEPGLSKGSVGALEYPAEGLRSQLSPLH